MARQVLENGVILPAEYSDDWYDDMTSNLTKLDDVIGSDSEKLSSADVGAAALSNNYNDLDNKPTIPTVNDATLTIQKNGVDVQTFTANASSNVTCNITVPTKTSDLTNDSNFVDTSNPAVSSGITSAKVTDYDTHIADTDIHVTTADKATWNTVTSKANDSDVVHKSGDETVGGVKTFDSNTYVYNSDNTATTPTLFLKNSKTSKGSTSETGSQLLKFVDKNNNNLCDVESVITSNGSCELRLRSNTLDSNNQNVQAGVTLISSINGGKRFCPTNNNNVSLGDSNLKWSRVYSTQYYYGNDNVEFSTKFVTTDTAQTISETKTFTNTIKINKEIELSGNRLAYILPNFSASYSGLSLCTYGANGAVRIGIWKVDDNDNTKHVLNDSLGYLNVSTGSSNSVNIVYLSPRNATDSKLGDSTNKWKSFNGVEPSSLSLPSGNANNVIDISSYITDLDGTSNSYTVPANGWISIAVVGTAIAIVSSSWSDSRLRESSGNVRMLYPVLKNETLDISVIGTTLAYARFIPCQGNV